MGSRYVVIEDTDVTKGGGSGQPLTPEFYCNTAGDAAMVAQRIAQIFQRGTRLVPVGTAGPYATAFAANLSMLAQSLVPSGITY